MTWGLVAVGTASLGSAAIGAGAASDAASTQAGAAGQSAAIQQAQYEQARADQMPWLNVATGQTTQANPEYTRLQELMDIIQTTRDPAERQAARDEAGGGTIEQIKRRFDRLTPTMQVDDPQNVGSLNELAQYGRSQVIEGDYIPRTEVPEFDSAQFDIYKDPSYEWRQGEQERMINRNMAGMGKVTSGNRLEEIMARSGEMASQEYGAARGRMLQDYGIERDVEATEYGRGVADYGRAYGEEGDYLNRLAALSQTGQTAATNMGQFGASAASNIGNALITQGGAQAAGEIGQAAAWQQGVGDLTSLYSMNQAQQPTTYNTAYSPVQSWSAY